MTDPQRFILNYVKGVYTVSIVMDSYGQFLLTRYNPIGLYTYKENLFTEYYAIIAEYKVFREIYFGTKPEVAVHLFAKEDEDDIKYVPTFTELQHIGDKIVRLDELQPVELPPDFWPIETDYVLSRYEDWFLHLKQTIEQ